MRAWLILGSTLLLLPALTSAQSSDPGAPGQPAAPPVTLTYVDGAVDIARDTGVSAADVPNLLEDGDRVLASNGRAELVFADGAVAFVDRDTELRVDADVRLRLVRGHIVVRTSAAGDLVLATPAGLARLAARGDYDLMANDLDGDTVLGTIRGRAELRTASGDLPVDPDDVLYLDPRNPRPRVARAYGLRTPLSDWADDRMNQSNAAMRGQPLPPVLAPYAEDFAGHGQWTSVPPYGPVWTPTVVAGWRPYGNGAWRATRYGWTWIDSDPWAWPMHHYGRWGRHASGRWFWIPQASWGPAWVSWAIGPDHVGWSPMGWDSRPVVDFFAGARVGPIDLWASTWSVVPRETFGRGLIGPHLQDLRYLPGPVLGGFVVQSRPPLGGRGRTETRRWTDRGEARPGGRRVPGPGAEPRRGEAPAVTTAPSSGWARPRDTRRDERSAPGESGQATPAPGQRSVAPGSGGPPLPPPGTPVYRVPRREPDAVNGDGRRGRQDNSTASPTPQAVPGPSGGSGNGGAMPGWSSRRSQPSPPSSAPAAEARPRGDGDSGRGMTGGGASGGEGTRGAGRAAPHDGGGGGGGGARAGSGNGSSSGNAGGGRRRPR